MKLLCCLLLTVLFIPEAPAQKTASPSSPNERQRRVILPSKTGQPSGASKRPPVVAQSKRPQAPPVAAKAPAKRNITLHWNGSFGNILDLDLELTGSGSVSEINCAGAIDEKSDIPAPIIKISSIVNESDGAYELEYSLGARVALKTTTKSPDHPPVHSFEFRDMKLSGSIVLKPGQAVTIANNHGKKLTVMMSFAD